MAHLRELVGDHHYQSIVRHGFDSRSKDALRAGKVDMEVGSMHRGVRLGRWHILVDNRDLVVGGRSAHSSRYARTNY